MLSFLFLCIWNFSFYFSLNGKIPILWKNNNLRGQCCPNGSKTALEKDLQDLNLEKGSVLQYVDGLICSPTKEVSDENTIKILNFLAERGYKISRSKAQITLQ